MKLESDLFDKIRTRKGTKKPKQEERATRVCEAEGCNAPATHRAPKGRDAEGEYFWFCLEHVRAYNKSYNYFAGLDDNDVQSFQKESIIGHRPTWRMGSNARSDEGPRPGGRAKYGFTGKTDDPFHLFGDGFRSRPSEEPTRRTVRNMERKSLATLGLDETAGPDEVKARYKTLVKRHHPDANGGDRSLEEKLREIIQAYSYLKSVGFC
ncbi:J domain-containing protein [Afifella sp. JA880]|uniref:J domain-containing protein n=1 Tax=Afifella sp. JA880 TaxID=2975280 RepID=UPI0021BB14B5|nr:J domain-containing protein [Afifella sp. JA880]MCT8268248.1 J domain-containing protein [Afifella sp. JA880]